MSRNVWNDVVSWQSRRLNNSTKCQHHALIIITSKKKNWNRPWKKSQKCAFKLFWNTYIWQVLEDLKFCDQWTKFHDRSQNGPKLVTNDYFVWSHTFIIIQVNFKQKSHVGNTAKQCRFGLFQNSDALSWNIVRFWKSYICSSDGCVRNKLQFRTVRQNQKSFLWMQDWGWTTFLRLTWGISLWNLTVFQNTNQWSRTRRLVND